MQFYKIIPEGIPKPIFAFEFITESFIHKFPSYENLLEFSLIDEGYAIRECHGNSVKYSSGEINYILNDSECKVYTDSYHKHFSVGAVFPHKYIVCHSDEFTKDKLTELRHEAKSDNIILLPCTQLATGDKKELKNRMLRIVRQFNTRGIGNKNTLMSLWYDVAGFLTDICLNKLMRSENLNISPSSILYCEKACKYISDHLYSKFKISDIAESISISENYLQTTFKSVMNISITDYTNNLRLEKAKEYFTKTNASLEEVASMFGFKDAGYFGRIFRRKYKVSIKNFKDYENKHIKSKGGLLL